MLSIIYFYLILQPDYISHFVMRQWEAPPTGRESKRCWRRPLEETLQVQLRVERVARRRHRHERFCCHLTAILLLLLASIDCEGEKIRLVRINENTRLKKHKVKSTRKGMDVAVTCCTSSWNLCCKTF